MFSHWKVLKVRQDRWKTRQNHKPKFKVKHKDISYKPLHHSISIWWKNLPLVAKKKLSQKSDRVMPTKNLPGGFCCHRSNTCLESSVATSARSEAAIMWCNEEFKVIWFSSRQRQKWANHQNKCFDTEICIQNFLCRQLQSRWERWDGINGMLDKRVLRAYLEI